MPVLKPYTDGSGHYIHASVRGSVFTFQTTARGVERLVTAGVQLGERFGLRLLADLTRTGDAFTHRGGIEFYEADQFEFDFKESEESNSLFPACAVTGTFDDLHLVAHKVENEVRTDLLAPLRSRGVERSHRTQRSASDFITWSAHYPRSERAVARQYRCRCHAASMVCRGSQRGMGSTAT